jgi:hypothetical protein
MKIKIQVTKFKNILTNNIEKYSIIIDKIIK